MTIEDRLPLRLLARKDFPFLEILMAAVVLYLLFVSWIGELFHSGERSLAAVNDERMTRLHMAVQTYRWANSSLPPDLSALLCPERANDSCVPLATPDILTDAWGTPFIYQVSGKAFTIKCLGADKRPGGYGPGQDITLAGS